MSVTDWKFPTNSANWGDAVGKPWTNPTYVQANDSNFASFAAPSKGSDRLSCNGFAFNVPSGATIDGAEIEISRYDSVSNNRYDSIFNLVVNGVGSANYASATKWSTSEGTITYGGANEKFGMTITQAHVLLANFGVIFSSGAGTTSTPYLNYIKMRLYYTAEGGAENARMIKVNGVWRSISNSMVKVNGVWKAISDSMVKINDWKK
jgi:hypothetical protein